MCMSEHKHDGKFIFGFFLGGLIGALVIFFLGTKEGKKMSKVLEKRGRDVLDELDDKLAELEKSGRDLVRKGEALKDEVMEAWEERRDTMTEAAAERFDTALANLEELQNKGMTKTASLRKRFRNLPKKTK